MANRYTYRGQVEALLQPGQVVRHDARGYFAGPPLGGAPAPNQGAAYQTMIRADPANIQGQANLRAEGIQAQTSTADQIRRMLIQYGVVPDGFKDPNGFVNDETRALAGKNTEAGLSTFARLKRAYEIANKQGRRGLAARGMLQSGALAQTLGENNLNFRTGQSDALNQLLSGVSGAQNDYASGALARERQLQDLNTTAAQTASQYAVAKPPLPPAPKLPSVNYAQAKKIAAPTGSGLFTGARRF